jgi:hypothetical protein
MIYKVGNSILWFIIILIATGTVADQITRNFSTNPTVLILTWFVILAFTITLVGKKIFSLGANSPAKMEVIKANVLMIVTSVGLVMAGIAIYLATLQDDLNGNLLATAVCSTIIASVLLYFLFKTRMVSIQESENKFQHEPWTSRLDNFLLGACIFVSVVFAAITYRPNTDDYYFVSLSTYIYEKDLIPIKDTILSDQYFNGFPRGASWEVLFGVIGNAFGIHPASILYLVVVPLATALGILVLAQLITVTQIKHARVALISVTIFLIFDGANGFTFGAYQGPRSWQGKSFFLTVLLPLIFVYLILLLQKYDVKNGIKFVLVLVAAVGATTTALLILFPLITCAIMIAVLYRKKQAVYILLLGNLYLLWGALAFRETRQTEQAESLAIQGMGLAVRLVNRISVESIPSTFELITGMAKPPWHSGLFAIVMVWGWLALKGEHSRDLFALSTAGWAFISLPRISDYLLEITGAAPVGWRFFWLIPIPLFVAATGSFIFEQLSRFQRSRIFPTTGATIYVLLLAILPVTLGTPPWKSLPLIDAELARPNLLKVGYGFNETYEALNKIGKPKDIVLARNGISASLAALTTNFYTVAPRDSYTRFAVRGFEDGFANDRIKLAKYMVGRETIEYMPGELEAALTNIEVNVVCLPSERELDIRLFQDLGYLDSEVRIPRSTEGSYMWCGRTNSFD